MMAKPSPKPHPSRHLSVIKHAHLPKIKMDHPSQEISSHELDGLVGQRAFVSDSMTIMSICRI